jgi:23S rRNA (cytosine1962-C5)-methyltransferase
MIAVTLKPGHVRPVWAGHPWVYAQGILQVGEAPGAGAEVRVVDPKGNVLGCGLYSPESAIRVRLYTRQDERAFDRGLIRERLSSAIARRAAFGLPSKDTTAYRVLNGEGDGVPGLVVDRFGDAVCVQFLTSGIRQRAEEILAVLSDELAPRTIVDRTGQRAAALEGFEATPGIIAGDSELDTLRFDEHGLRFEVPLSLAQKTGFYLDLRQIRQRLALLARGRSVLDCYSYVGAAGLAMARAGARDVLSVDSSARAIEVARDIARLNGSPANFSASAMDAFEALEAARLDGGRDLVLCDFATSRSATQACRHRHTSFIHSRIEWRRTISCRGGLRRLKLLLFGGACQRRRR